MKTAQEKAQSELLKAAKNMMSALKRSMDLVPMAAERLQKAIKAVEAKP